MKEATLTSKRQATLPAELCEELGLRPGDRLRLERRVIGGETVWIVRGRRLDWSWFGGARRWARGKSNAWSAVERSISSAWGRGGRS